MDQVFPGHLPVSFKGLGQLRNGMQGIISVDDQMFLHFFLFFRLNANMYLFPNFSSVQSICIVIFS